MADDVTLPGDGSVVATDEVGGRHYQLVKLVVGGEGEAEPLSRASPQPVVDEAVEQLLVRLLARLNAPQGYDPSVQRNKVTATIESGTLSTVSNVSSVGAISSITTLTNLANINNLPADLLVRAQLTSAWAAAVRPLVS